MPKIVAVNASPRTSWNTATLVRDAADGAREAGAEVQLFDLYQLDPFMGCRSCFACKRGKTAGRCVYPDGLTPVLDAIREADGVIIGTPNYLGDVSAALYALKERLVFQNLTYQTDPRWYREPNTPTLFIMTSNAPDGAYQQGGFYSDMLQSKLVSLSNAIGPARAFVCGSTLQVEDYSRYNWTMFDADERRLRRERTFPLQREQVREMGAELVNDPWA